MAKDKAAATATAAAALGAEPEDLPKTIVRRVVKDKLSQLCDDGGDVILHKEAHLAFSESARIFIHYLSATAHDICSESNRQVISAEDVLKGLEEIEFSEFVEPLRASLEELRKKNAGKRAGSAKAKEEKKKQKTEEQTVVENGKEGKEEDGEEMATENGGEEEDREDVEEETPAENGQVEGKEEEEEEEDDDDDNDDDDGAEDEDEKQASEDIDENSTDS